MNNTDLEYAGFWIRVGATLIDTLILLTIITPILWMYYGESYFLQNASTLGTLDIFMNYIFPAIVVIIFWIYKSATPGKTLLGLKILDSNTGEPISKSQAIIRYISYYLASIPLLLGILWVAWDKKKQGWHDKIAKTVVVRNTNHSTEDVSFEKK